MNTGNNLLYLLVSMLLGLIVVSGVLSEQSMRRLRFESVAPEEIFADRETPIGVRVGNGKRWRTSYSLRLDGSDGGDARGAYIPRLPPGVEQLVTWPVTFARRGRHPLPRLRVSTRFPFGLFVKAGVVRLEGDLLVYPALSPVAADRRRELAATGASIRRRGRGSDVYNLRDYRAGDEPRLIHWRSSAKTGSLVVRELEADTTQDVRIVLAGRGADAARVEAALSEAASLVVHLLGTGGAVELSGPGLYVPLGRGGGQRRRVLTALALFDPAAVAPDGGVSRSSRALREIVIAL
jgi:uncharacterized protein (DUF58 family)